MDSEGRTPISSGGAQPRQARSSQMSEQQDWIARKKAEIEAKKDRLHQQGQSASGSVHQYRSLDQMARPSGSESSPGLIGSKRKGLGLKNRW